MNLTELKQKPIAELLEMSDAMGLENMARSRKQDIIFALLKKHAKSGEEISGDGVLEILQDGFGFLRSADSSYLAGPDDIYVSPSQIRRFNLRTGDTIIGKIRPPKEGERYFALLKVDSIDQACHQAGHRGREQPREAGLDGRPGGPLRRNRARPREHAPPGRAGAFGQGRGAAGRRGKTRGCGVRAG